MYINWVGMQKKKFKVKKLDFYWIWEKIWKKSMSGLISIWIFPRKKEKLIFMKKCEKKNFILFMPS